MSNPQIKEVTDDSFEADVMQASESTPVLVDFWATWCGPCIQLEPMLDELANSYKGQIQIVRFNVTEGNRATPAKFGVRGLPTLMTIKKGTVVGAKVGALQKADLLELIENALK